LQRAERSVCISSYHPTQSSKCTSLYNEIYKTLHSTSTWSTSCTTHVPRYSSTTGKRGCKLLSQPIYWAKIVEWRYDPLANNTMQKSTDGRNAGVICNVQSIAKSASQVVNTLGGSENRIKKYQPNSCRGISIFPIISFGVTA